MKKIKKSFGNFFDDQMKWEYMKFEIRKFTISYSKIRSKNNRKIKDDLENKLKDLEIDLNNCDKLQKYNKIKSKLEEIFEKFVEGAKVWRFAQQNSF